MEGTLESKVEVGGELPALVVAPQQIQSIRELDFEGDDECKYFAGEAAAVDVVSEEEILGGL